MSDLIQFDPPDPDDLSDLLQGYEVTSLIAKGGMGAVYKATQISLDRPVAIKLLPKELGDDPAFREQFRAEARAMARLNHVNLIGIYDFGEADGMPYIVMEYVAGKSLYYSIYGKQIDQTTASKLIVGICRGLAHAHEADIVHRDIKPANILLDPKAKPKIGDFGLAAAAELEDEEDGVVFGTPGYAAPEILSDPKAIGVPSDIFAVGVILHELLTGELPGTPPTPPSMLCKCDRRLDPIVKKATRRNPALRYQSANELADDLEEIIPTLGSDGRRSVKTSVGGETKRTVTKLNTSPTTLKKRLNTSAQSVKDPSPQATPVPSDGTHRGQEAVGPKALLSESDAPPPSSAGAPTLSPSSAVNSTIIRNLIIIAVLIPVIFIVWTMLQDKEAKIAQQKADADQARKEKTMAREAELKEMREAAAARMRERNQKKEKQETLSDETREKLAELEASKTPMELLAEFRVPLAEGQRDLFPKGTIDRSTHYWFFVDEPMTWADASEFAIQHGGHLATPAKQSDLNILTQKMGSGHPPVWIGGGAQGNVGWGWVDGSEWIYDDPGTSLGSCAALSETGVIRARPNAEKNPFVIEWSRDGANPGTLDAQLQRLVPTLDSPTPAWPPSSVVHQSRTFYFAQRSVSWTEADAIAHSAEGHLAVFSEPLEAAFLQKYLARALLPEQSLWIGGQKKDDQWTWCTGEAWARAYWAPDAPDGGPSDRALRYLRAGGGDGWDDARSGRGGATGLLIEWSPDAKKAPPKETKTTAIASRELTKLKGMGLRLVTKELDEYKRFLRANRGTLVNDVSTWYRLLTKNNQAVHEAFFNAFLEQVPKEGSLKGKLDFENVPVEVKQNIDRALTREALESRTLDDKLEVLRKGYLRKLYDLRDRFEKDNLKTQMNLIDQEVQRVGQTGASFRQYFGV